MNLSMVLRSEADRGHRFHYILLILFIFFLSSLHVTAQTCDYCPAPSECKPCKDDLTSLTLRYVGSVPIDVVVSDAEEEYFSETVSPFTEFTVTGQKGKGKGKGRKNFKKDAINVYVNGILIMTIDVTCGFNLDPTVRVGDFYIIAAESKKNGSVCCSASVGLVPPVITGCPSDISVSTSATQCGNNVTWIEPVATDCDLQSFISSKSPGAFFPVGTTLVTYTAQGTDGQTSTCSFNVTVVDNVSPQVTTCPANITVNADGNCVAKPTWTPPVFTDNCGINNVTSTKLPGSTFPIGLTIVTYTAVDNAGNFVECKFNVTVEDNMPPVVLTCPSDILLPADLNCQAQANWTLPTFSDNCNTVIITSNYSPGATFNVGTTEVKYTGTDNAGNFVECSFSVVVAGGVGTGVPTVTDCPADIYSNANASCKAVVTWIPPTFKNSCGLPLAVTTTHSPGSTFNMGSTQVKYTGTDVFNNSVECIFNVIVEDKTKPRMVTPEANFVYGALVGCKAPVSWSPPVFSDNCSLQSTLSNYYPNDEFSVGNTTVTYTAIDAAGNSLDYSFVITVVDNIAPAFTYCPGDITVSAGILCNAIASWTEPTVTDNCVAVTVVASHTSGSTFAMGTTLVTYTGKDAAGNTATCTFNIIVEDKTEPIISDCPDDIYLLAVSTCSAIATWSTPTFIDRCSSVTVSASHTSGSTFPVGSTLVTYTGTDSNGNEAECSFTVFVEDKTAPIVSNCPTDIILTAGPSCTAIATWTAPTFIDNCGTVTVTPSHSSGSAFSLGTTAVNYLGEDASGNATSCSFNVIVEDTTKPVITNCPVDITLTAGASCNAIATWTPPTFTDNCGAVTVISSPASGSTFAIGTTPVTYTGKDAAGNESICTFNIIVEDKTKPVITNCPVDITLAAGVSCNAIATWTPPTFTDNCGAVTVVASHTSGSTFAIGTTPVTYTGKDAAGNESICAFNIIVEDKTKPVITNCPVDITLTAGASCNAIATWTPPTFTDNCGAVTVVASYTSGSTFSTGSTLVKYTGTDSNGNSRVCSFTVFVEDKTAPIVSNCPTDIILTAGSSCTAIATWTAPTFTDNCVAVTVVATQTSGSAFATGTTPVTYSGKDAAGNETTCTFNVIVEDNTKPGVASCPTDILLVANTSCSAIATWPAPVFTDNCGAVMITSSHSSGSKFMLGTTLVKYTGTDASGNEMICSFNIIVEDKTPPVVSNCPTDIMVTAAGSCNAIASWTPPTFTDNCSAVTIVSSHQPGDVFNLGSTLVLYTATDAVGNKNECSFNVVVADTTPPIVSTVCPGEIIVVPSQGCDAIVTWTPPTFTDNCGQVASVLASHQPGNTFSVGTTLITYTATDNTGNVNVCSFAVTIKDVNPPVLKDGPADILVTTSQADTTLRWEPPVATDACGLISLESTHSPGDAFSNGRTEVTYTATDNSGNQTTFIFSITVLPQDISLIIGKLITPEGSDLNQWLIGNIGKYTSNKVVIVDRWGSVVFETDNYDNQNRLWIGQDKKGTPLPTGTYFYSVSVSTGGNWIEKKGFIELVR